MNKKLNRQDLLYPDLSYTINGVLFDVFKEIGYGFQEKYYQKATGIALKKKEISFEEQLPVTLKYRGENIGKYFLDFLIEGQIVLELKQGNYFRKQNIDQVFGYLKAKNLELGILANFTENGVKTKRIINLQ